VSDAGESLWNADERRRGIVGFRAIGTVRIGTADAIPRHDDIQFAFIGVTSAFIGVSKTFARH